MPPDRLLRPSTALLLGVGGLLLLALLFLLTWRSLREEESPLPSPRPSATPLPNHTAPPSTSGEDRTMEEPPFPKTSPGDVEIAPTPSQETPEPIPYHPSAPVPAVFGATGNAILTNIPYAPGLEDIANDFIEKVKQGGWDTTSEAYKKNWEKAVEETDSLVRARYGTEVYLRLKQEAAP